DDHHIEIGPLRRHIGEEGRPKPLEVLGHAVAVLDLDAKHAGQRRDASVPPIDRLPDQKTPPELADAGPQPLLHLALTPKPGDLVTRAAEDVLDQGLADPALQVQAVS